MADGSLGPAAALEPDLGAARLFLDFVGIDPARTKTVFCTFDDVVLLGGKKRGDPTLLKTFWGTFEEHATELCRLNHLGAGVFFLVNVPDGGGSRRKENITGVRAIWRDLDGGEAKETPLPPHVIVETSPGKRQEYFLVDQQRRLSVEQFSGCMRRMVRDYGADPSAADRARVLRIPGFLHRKGIPHLVTARTPSGDLVPGFQEAYSADQILEAFPPIRPRAERNASTAPTGAPRTPAQMAAVKEMLAAIKHLCDERKTWLDVGFALSHYFNQSEDGLEIWKDWSAESSKCKEGEQEEVWAASQNDKRDPITIGTLVTLARGCGWNGHLPEDTSDAFSIIEAPPGVTVAHDDGSRGWPAPDLSVLKVQRIAPPAFPKDVLGPIASFLEQASAAAGAPIDYGAAGLIAGAAALIGNARKVFVRPMWVQPATLWVAAVGSPSTNKTTGLNVGIRPINQIEEELARDLPDRLRQHEADIFIAGEHRKRWETAIKEAVKAHVPPPPMPVEAQEPQPPFKFQIKVHEATQEAVADLASKQTRGVLVFRDEISGWIGSMDRYTNTSGADRSFYLEGYEAGPFDVLRKSKGASVHIPRLSVSIAGGIQPDKMEELLLSGSDDGLSSRFLYFFPDPAPFQREVVAVDAHRLERAFRRLVLLGFSSEGEPVEVPLAAGGLRCFLDWVERHVSFTRLQTGLYASAVGKMQGQALRLALVLEHLLWAWSDNEAAPPQAVSRETIQAAIKLMDEYFHPMLRRVLGEASITHGERAAVVLARAVIDRKCLQLNKRDVKRTWKLQGLRSSETVDAAVKELVEAGWLTAAEKASGRGRPSGTYYVNPRLFEE